MERGHVFHIDSRYQPAAREIGLDAEGVFDHPLVRAWRHLPDRENCTLDADLADGSHVRWHVKRYTAPGRRSAAAADAEVRGFQLLVDHNIPTAPLVGWGHLADGRAFVISEDLAGYTPADKLVGAGMPFDRLLEPTARLAAELHNAGLHHRDLYLCHFMAKADDGGAIDLKLIDVARLRPLPRLFNRGRWVVKDLAQFWYSTTKLPVTDEQRRAWLDCYNRQALARHPLLRRRIMQKSNAIDRHDRNLVAAQPRRNISIPQAR